MQRDARGSGVLLQAESYLATLALHRSAMDDRVCFSIFRRPAEGTRFLTLGPWAQTSEPVGLPGQGGAAQLLGDLVRTVS